MTNEEAYGILEEMASDLTNAISGSSNTNPVVHEIRRRICAIDRAQNALLRVTPPQ